MCEVVNHELITFADWACFDIPEHAFTKISITLHYENEKLHMYSETLMSQVI